MVTFKCLYGNVKTPFTLDAKEPKSDWIKRHSFQKRRVLGKWGSLLLLIINLGQQISSRQYAQGWKNKPVQSISYKPNKRPEGWDQSGSPGRWSSAPPLQFPYNVLLNIKLQYPLLTWENTATTWARAVSTAMFRLSEGHHPHREAGPGKDRMRWRPAELWPCLPGVLLGPQVVQAAFGNMGGNGIKRTLWEEPPGNGVEVFIKKRMERDKKKEPRSDLQQWSSGQ